MKARTLLVGIVAAALLTGAAEAKPRKSDETLRYGFVADVTGSGCEPATLSRDVDSRDAVAFEPDAGDVVGSATVTDTRLGGGQATWTLEPRRPECEAGPWGTGRRAWAVTYEDSVYAVRSRRSEGMRSIAGFRVDRHGRRAPTVRRARRALGRPSWLRRRGDVVCRGRWRRLSLRIDFVTFGGGNPCRHGFAQLGRVRGRHAERWTAIVGRDPGVTFHTEEDYLDATGTGKPDPDSRREWILAEVHVPIGTGDAMPAVSALLNRRGRVNGFDFWIGAAGD